MGLPEVIYSSEDEAYLHLPGVIVTEKAGETRYLLSDGLGSVRQVLDESGAVVAYNEFDPYGNPVQNDSSPYGYTGEWWQDEVELLHLRARWYMPETGTFLSRDAWEGNSFQPQSFNGWNYVEENPVLYIDPSGNCRRNDTDCLNKAQSIVNKYPNTKIHIGNPLVNDLCGYNIYIQNKYWKTSELEVLESAIDKVFIAFDNNTPAFQRAIPEITFIRRNWSTRGDSTTYIVSRILVYDDLFISYSPEKQPWIIIHEFAHAIDTSLYIWTPGFVSATGGTCSGLGFLTGNCVGFYTPGPNLYRELYDESNTKPKEDFAEGFVLWVRYKNPGTPKFQDAHTYNLYQDTIDYMENVVLNHYR